MAQATGVLLTDLPRLPRDITPSDWVLIKRNDISRQDCKITYNDFTKTLLKNSSLYSQGGKVVDLDIDGKLPAVDGSNLLNINADSITGGQINVDRIQKATTTVYGVTQLANSGNAQNLAATPYYVNTKVSKSGDTMNGDLTFTLGSTINLDEGEIG